MGVPFVDALTTERDPTLPLTVGEWEEWGKKLRLSDSCQWPDIARLVVKLHWIV